MKIVLLLTFMVKIATALSEVYLLAYSGYLIDLLSSTSAENVWTEHSGSLIWAIVFVLVLRPLAYWLQNLIEGISLQCNTTTMFRWSAYSHVMNQPVNWFQKDFSGRITSRMFNAGNFATEIVVRFLNVFAYALVYVVGIMLFIGSEVATFAIPVFLWLVLYIALLWYAIPRSIGLHHNFEGKKSFAVGWLVDRISNFETVAFYSPREQSLAGYRVQLEDIRAALLKTKIIQLVLRTSIILIEGIMLVAFVGYGIWLWKNGQISLGMVGIALALSIRLSALAGSVFGDIWVVLERIGSLKEALKTIASPLKIKDKSDAVDFTVSGGAIELNQVSHSYGKADGHAGVRGINLTIAAGEKVALVGHSGAGKSTLINLIMRSHECEQGSISLDGVDIKDMTQESLRASISVVSQQSSLFNQSVKDNIAFGNPDVSFDDIVHAAKEAKAHEFIEKLIDDNGNKGYEAFVGERGVTLSGGQRQRIAIARALLKNAKILILDEATSALDSEMESEIQAALANAMKNKTVIAIAHRLSTITEMDRILVLENGRIIEQGSHAELVASDATYAKLWSLQTSALSADAQMDETANA